jgi:hypothetical protein
MAPTFSEFPNTRIDMKSRSALFRALCLAALAAGGVCEVGAQELIWEAERPLTWADFRGPAPGGTEARDVAVTAASLNWSYEYEFERSAAGCSYRIADIRVSAVFHPENSWVRAGHATESVLAHEQGHFDITQIHKLMLEELARGFVGATGSCKGRSSKRAARFVEEDIARIVGPHYRRIAELHTRLQASYDSETGHGTRHGSQQSWLDRISGELRRGRLEPKEVLGRLAP